MDLTVFAQTNTAQRLREAAARGTLSHALIFSGPGERTAAARYAAAALLQTIRSRCVEVKLPPAGTVGEDDERTRELLRLIAEGRAAARAAFLLKLETAKATREELAALFEGARVILADALCTLCGAPPAEPRDEQALRAVLGSRLTKAQILGTIELLETYRNHCEYNVGVGPLLGGLAVELEEIL